MRNYFKNLMFALVYLLPAGVIVWLTILLIQVVVEGVGLFATILSAMFLIAVVGALDYTRTQRKRNENN